MTKPLLSVVMPVHCGERWIAAALDSLCLQDGRDFECLIIDSSPDDASLNIIERYSDRLPLRVERRQDILPWTEKTNLAARQAVGRYISMLHQDDAWEPGRLATVRRWYNEQPTATMFLHPTHLIDEQGRRLGAWRCPLPVSDVAISRDFLLSRLIVQNFIAVPSAVIEREAFLAAGGLDKDLWYTADWDLYLKLAASGDVFYRSDILTSFRIHDSSQTIVGSRSPDQFRDQMQRVLDRHEPQLSARNRRRSMRAAATSININVALARLNNGEVTAIGSILAAVLALGPAAGYRYFRDSRLIERVAPRVRVRLAGAL